MEPLREHVIRGWSHVSLDARRAYKLGKLRRQPGVRLEHVSRDIDVADEVAASWTISARVIAQSRNFAQHQRDKPLHAPVTIFGMQERQRVIA